MKKFFFIVLTLIVFSSCNKDMQDPGKTQVADMANEWWVTLTLNGVDIYGLGYFKLATYNTSADNNQLWVDDLKNSWGFKAKATADVSAKTFAAAASANSYYNAANPAAFPLTVNISNGKVLANAGHSKMGNVSDSISFNIEFSDDPGNIYQISGTARTKYLEDDY
jgi:hypothetical protein